MELFELKEKLSEFGLEWFNKYYGLYAGFVHSVDDEENVGRLQLIVPAVYKQPFKYWAHSRGIYAGKGIGFFFMPNVGDKVWVSFENGDPRFPVWEYGWWAKGDTPTGATPEIKVIQTTAGHRIVMNDKKNEEKISIKDKKGNEIVLDKNGLQIISYDGTALQKTVLGETLKGKLDDLFTQLDSLCTALEALTVGTALGPSSPPINVAQITAVQTQLGVIKGQMNTVLSEHVKNN